MLFGCPLLSIFFPFLIPYLTLEISEAEGIFSTVYCSLPSVRNWKYAAYRGTSHVPAVDDGVSKEDTAIRCGMTLDGDWWKATLSDFQANTMTYDRVTSAGVGQRKTSGNGKWHIKFSSRTTRKLHWSHLGFGPPAAQLSTTKQYTQTRRGEFVIIRPGSQPNFYFSC